MSQKHIIEQQNKIPRVMQPRDGKKLTTMLIAELMAKKERSNYDIRILNDLLKTFLKYKEHIDTIKELKVLKRQSRQPKAGA